MIYTEERICLTRASPKRHWIGLTLRSRQDQSLAFSELSPIVKDPFRPVLLNNNNVEKVRRTIFRVLEGPLSTFHDDDEFGSSRIDRRFLMHIPTSFDWRCNCAIFRHGISCERWRSIKYLERSIQRNGGGKRAKEGR